VGAVIVVYVTNCRTTVKATVDGYAGAVAEDLVRRKWRLAAA
jgi:hypothetical protein